jgi:hypothetical protein
MKRIKSFTVMELTVAVFISGLLFSMVLYFLNAMQYKSLQFLKASNALTEVNTFSWLLENDFSKAIYIVADTEPQTIRFLSDSTNVKYRFSEDFVLRVQSEVTDTFYFNTYEWTITQENKIVPQNQIVDELSFTMLVDEQIINLAYFKQYSATDRMLFSQTKHR